MSLKRYSRKEPLVFIWVMVPYIIFMNLLVFGSCILQSVGAFAKSFGITTFYFSIVYGIFGWVAVMIRHRFAAPGDLFKRVRIMLPVFYIMNGLGIYGIYELYEVLDLVDCVTKPERYGWTVLYGCIMSTLITFINEGMANWESWKNSLSESEKLKNAYQRSKLLGLKGQINPHFLFNCFNSLSGLIQEDEARAEKFLDEMTKVHRYLLRGDDVYLVNLGEEMKFATSYLYLTQARFGEALKVSVQLPEHLMSRKIPPLSMQVILENIIYTNALNRREPLNILITADDKDNLLISHSLHEKVIVQHLNVDEGLDNLVTKYLLLHSEGIRVQETGHTRRITVPLFAHNPVRT